MVDLSGFINFAFQMSSPTRDNAIRSWEDEPPTEPEICPTFKELLLHFVRLIVGKNSEVRTMSERVVLLAFIAAFVTQPMAQPSLFSRASLHSFVQETFRCAWEIYFAHKANYGTEEFSAFRQLAVSLAEGGLFTEAVQVLKTMPKPTKTIAESQYWDAYCQVAIVAAKMGHHDLANQLAAQIPNFTSYFKEPEGAMHKSSVIKAIANNLENLPPDKAMQCLKEAIPIAQQITDNFRRGDAICALAKAAAKFDLREAKALSAQVNTIAEKCPKDTQRLHLLVSIASVINRWDTQKSKRLFDRAMTIALRQPQKYDQRDWSIWWVVTGMIETGLWDEAIKATNLLPETRPKVPLDAPSLISPPPPTKWEALKVIVEKLAEKRLFAKALQVADTIREPYNRALAYTFIAKFMAKSEPQKARQLLWQGMEMATKEVDPKLASSLIITVVGTASAIAPQEANKLALKAVKSLQRLDDYNASRSLSWLASEIATVDIKTAQKLFTTALERARKVSKPDHRMTTLEVIVGQMCQAKLFSEAQKLLPEIERTSLARGNVSPGRWCLSMQGIIVAMAEAGQVKQALALLPKLNPCRDEERFEAMIAVAKSLVRSDTRSAEKLLQEALKIARSKWLEYERQKQSLAQLHGSRIYPPYDAFNFKLQFCKALICQQNQAFTQGQRLRKGLRIER